MAACILIIDPQIDRREDLRRKLQRGFHDVLVAASAAAALPLLRLHKPDVILCHGTIFSTAVRHIRSDPNGLDAQIIAVGHIREAVGQLGALRQGADDILSEGVDSDTLNKHIRKLTKQRDARPNAQKFEPWALCEGETPFQTKP